MHQAVERFLGRRRPSQIAHGRQADARGRAPRGPQPAHARGGQRGPPQVRRVARDEREGRLRQARARARRPQGAARLGRAEVPRRTSAARSIAGDAPRRPERRERGRAGRSRGAGEGAPARRERAAAGRVARPAEAQHASAPRSRSSRPRRRASRTRRRSPPRPRARPPSRSSRACAPSSRSSRSRSRRCSPPRPTPSRQAAKARGDAAPTAENGKATAEALSHARRRVGGRRPAGARTSTCSQQLEAVVSAAVARVQQMDIAELEVVDGGDGNSLAHGGLAASRSASRASSKRRGAPWASTSGRSSAGTSSELAPSTLRGGAR